MLATNVIVHPGITIGEGAVVASNSVVTKNLEPWGVYMGSPAKRMKDRERNKIIDLEEDLKIKYGFTNSDFKLFIERNIKNSE